MRFGRHVDDDDDEGIRPDTVSAKGIKIIDRDGIEAVVSQPWAEHPVTSRVQRSAAVRHPR